MRPDQIVIRKSPTADSRTAPDGTTKQTLLESSYQHIEDVRKAMEFFVQMIRDAANVHDFTKISDIDDFYHSFSRKLTGDDFKAERWYQTHLSKERHHLNDSVPDDVTLIDVLERVADIVMAGMARSGEVYDEGIDPEMLVKAFNNTISFLKSKVKVVE